MSFSSGRGLVGSVLIQGLLVWRVARGSALAWTLGLLVALGAVASVFLMAAPFGVALTLIVAVCLAQAGVLLTRPAARPRLVAAPNAASIGLAPASNRQPTRRARSSVLLLMTLLVCRW